MSSSKLDTMREELRVATQALADDAKQFAAEARRLKEDAEQRETRKKVEDAETARIDAERREILRASAEVAYVRKLMHEGVRFGIGSTFDNRVRTVLRAEYKMELASSDTYHQHCRDCQSFYTQQGSWEHGHGHCEKCKDRWCAHCGGVRVDRPGTECQACQGRYSPPCRHA
jgi:hypothetical protein